VIGRGHETGQAKATSQTVAKGNGYQMSTLVRKVLSAEARAVKPGVFDVTLSTSAIDRENDRIIPSGWQISRSSRVPLLWSHKPDLLPLGVVTDIHVAGDALRGRMTFTPRGVNAFADTVSDLIDAGFLTTVSVGFRPLDSPVVNEAGGFTYHRNELLELSCVNIPAAPTATIDAHTVAAVQKLMMDPSAEIAVFVDEPDRIVLPLTETELRDAIASATRESFDESLNGRNGREDERIVLPLTESEMRDAIKDAVSDAVNAFTGQID
jgi:HK97 family phage prohead protease